jgi:tRNA pseudouridine38-40 synthase
MPLYRLILSYDGTDFAGWQIQEPTTASRPPQRTVQGTLEDVLAGLSGGARVRVAGAGRTDAGVHALGQVAAFELARDWEPHALERALNGLLPADVRVLAAERAPEGFHPRRHALAKLYRYELDMGPVQVATRRRTAGHVPWILDEERVRRAAALYEGRHDFASLASAGGSVKTTVRHVTRSEVRIVPGVGAGVGPTLVYEVEADGFLRKMVRSLVGGLVAVGRGHFSLEDLRAALDAADRRRWPPPVAACGLTLVRVDYPAVLT